MTEQLYKLEHRDRLEMSSGIDIWDKKGMCYTLRPVPAPRTLAWAMGEMVAHPMREYGRVPHERWRYNNKDGFIECQRNGDGIWMRNVLIDMRDLSSTSWSPCEEEQSPDMEPKRGAEFAAHLQKASETVATWPKWKQEILGGTASEPVAQPGSYAEAYHHVVAGGRARNGINVARDYRESNETVILGGPEEKLRTSWSKPHHSMDYGPDGWTIEEPKPAIVPGSREWLLSLPDGTEVEHECETTTFYYVKDGTFVIQKTRDGNCHVQNLAISMLSDSGWRLRAHPQAEPTLEQRVDAIAADVAELKMFARADGLLFRVERLEKLMEVKP